MVGWCHCLFFRKLAKFCSIKASWCCFCCCAQSDDMAGNFPPHQTHTPVKQTLAKMDFFGMIILLKKLLNLYTSFLWLIPPGGLPWLWIVKFVTNMSILFLNSKNMVSCCGNSPHQITHIEWAKKQSQMKYLCFYSHCNQSYTSQPL